MSLWTRDGTPPTELPFADRDAAGNGWSDLAANPMGRQACGWTPAPPPAFDPAAQRLAWIGTGWAVIDHSAAELADARLAVRAGRLAELAAIRWQHQQRFTWVAIGAPVPSDAETIALLAAKVAVMRERGEALDASFTWKTGPGSFAAFTLGQLLAYGDAIDVHVQLCFDREAALAAQLVGSADAASIDLTQGWPV